MNKDKIETAAALFGEGFNCAQAVVAAYGTQYGFTREQCLKMSASFGGGIGRMRETCGAACGLFLLAGLETGAIEGRDTASKMNNYATVKKLADRFIEENGALRCEDILSLAREGKCAAPCVERVRSAARLWEEYRRSDDK
ncbi:MAG: C_GCAxxG_C_C family protein [Flavobacteriales bacterium]|nr:C_GCAxxG_C_C family protein [Flavobacteriales bacterium]